VCIGRRSRKAPGAPDGASTVAADNVWRYAGTVIRSFRGPEAEKLLRRERSRAVPPNVQRVALRKLVQLDAAESLMDLRVPPGNRLEKLAGDRAGQYSVRINDQWRICFVWRGGDAYEVEIADYH
jgi:proteic killer suppression protein